MAGDGKASTCSTVYAVTLNTPGTVLVVSTSSGGIAAQSIGGGGGGGGFTARPAFWRGVGSGAWWDSGGSGGSGAGKNVFSSVASNVQTLGTDRSAS
jgi:hypothetical protein